MVARRAHNPEAVGSSPAFATTHKKLEDPLVFSLHQIQCLANIHSKILLSDPLG